MKRIYLLIVTGLLLTFKSEAKRIEGIIISENDTIRVTFNIPFSFFAQDPNYVKLQNKVKYFDASGRKITLLPDQAKEIQFTYGNKSIRMLSKYNSFGTGNIFSSSKNIFLKLETDGKLRLFTYYDTRNAPGMYNASTGAMTGGYSYSTDRYILQKGEGELKRPKVLSFKKDMAEYFSDCPALVEKIKSKDFRINDLQVIASFYNTHCR